MREYGLDLRECLWGSQPMGARRLLALIRGLSPGCALHRSLDPTGHGSGWTTKEELLAVIAELLDAGNRMYYSAHSKQGSRLPDALQIQRPKLQARKQASPSQLKRFLSTQGALARGSR